MTLFQKICKKSDFFLHFLYYYSNIAKKIKKKLKKSYQKICTYQKNVLPLQRQIKITL